MYFHPPQSALEGNFFPIKLRGKNSTILTLEQIQLFDCMIEIFDDVETPNQEYLCSKKKRQTTTMKTENRPFRKGVAFFRLCVSRTATHLNKLIHLGDTIDVAAAETLIRSNVAFHGPNVPILICAIVIASIGLNINSIPVIIGAMLVSPLMGPIIGFGLGLGINDTHLLKASLKNFGIMVTVSLVTSSLYFAISPLRMNNPSELLARTQPTIYDVLIAFVGGSAGIIETARKQRGTVLSGVAIATALMPPLCTVGFAIAQWNWQYALGAFYLFSINSIFIALATFLGVKYLHFPDSTTHKSLSSQQKKRLRMSIAFALMLIMVPSILTAITLIKQNNFNRAVDAFITEENLSGKNIFYNQKITHTSRKSSVEFYIIGNALTPPERDSILKKAQTFGIKDNQITLYQATNKNNQL